MQRDMFPVPHSHAQLQAIEPVQSSDAFPITSQPSRRSNTQSRTYPNRGRAWARSRMRIRKADWSFAWLR